MDNPVSVVQVRQALEDATRDRTDDRDVERAVLAVDVVEAPERGSQSGSAYRTCRMREERPAHPLSMCSMQMQM